MSIFKKGQKNKKEEGKETEKKNKKEEITKEGERKTPKNEVKKIEKKETYKPAIKKGESSISSIRLSDVLLSAHITEKPTFLAEKNQYVFKVWRKANKIEIKKAVEKFYNVKVEKVMIIKVPPKKRRVGRTIGTKKGYKKAIVKIKKGQRIDLLPR